MTSFIPCVKWVKQGASSNQNIVKLTQKELQELTNKKEVSNKKKSDDYGLENYDKEDMDISSAMAISNLATYHDNFDDSDDSDKFDEVLKSDDNLILVGNVKKNECSLEVYVYNNNDNDFYIHHDISLKHPPLCLEWCGIMGNFCALGSMSAVIDIWDIDLIGCLEPTLRLGRKKKKNSEKNYGHSDAVLDLSWNEHLPHIFASGSVDETVLLWDLEIGEPNTQMEGFGDHVQSLKWHPLESQTLAVGSSDFYIYDCRTYDTYKVWSVKGKVEKMAWDPSNGFLCYVGSDRGRLICFDCRMDKPLWKYRCHEKEITGIYVWNKNIVTSSSDETLKVWDKEKKHLIKIKEFSGALHSLDGCVECPNLLAVGGSGTSKFQLFDINNYSLKTC
ncbi:periodic tryptophan protein 1 homolog [Daktulosphaira vitifoliae]|uniref:periodic tryptophan protein 1 homolog n=1 Tax=Daktulosphaira vitifoliae TaxID=58002 RepID=UPI0021AA74C8|nr:periodic tryptophan protein 1 homolog [Daktulosphaira vitifoliae]